MADAATSFQKLIAFQAHVLSGGIPADASPSLSGPALSLLAINGAWRVDGLARTRRAMLDVLANTKACPRSVVPSIPNEVIADVLGRAWGATAPPWSAEDLRRALLHGTHGFFALSRQQLDASPPVSEWTAMALEISPIASSVDEACSRWSGGSSESALPTQVFPSWDAPLDTWPTTEHTLEIVDRLRVMLGHYSVRDLGSERVGIDLESDIANAVVHEAGNRLARYVDLESSESLIGLRLNRLAIGIWNESHAYRRPHRLASLAASPVGVSNHENARMLTRAVGAVGKMFVDDALIPGDGVLPKIRTVLAERQAMDNLLRTNVFSRPVANDPPLTLLRHDARLNPFIVDTDTDVSLDIERILVSEGLSPGDAFALAQTIADVTDHASRVELAELYVRKREQSQEFERDRAGAALWTGTHPLRRQLAVADQTVSLTLLYDGRDRTIWRRLRRVIEYANADGSYPYAILSIHRDAAVRDNKEGKFGAAAHVIENGRLEMMRVAEVTSDLRQVLESEHQLGVATTGLLVTMIEKHFTLTPTDEIRVAHRSTGLDALSARCASALSWSRQTHELLGLLEKQLEGGVLPPARAADGEYLSWAGWHSLTRAQHLRVLLAVATAQRAGFISSRSTAGHVVTDSELHDAYAHLLSTEHMTKQVSANLVRQATWLSLLSYEGMIPVVRAPNETVPYLLRGDLPDLERPGVPFMALRMAESAQWHVDSKDLGTLGRIPDSSSLSRFFDRTTRARWREWRTHVEVLQSR